MLRELLQTLKSPFRDQLSIQDVSSHPMQRTCTTRSASEHVSLQASSTKALLVPCLVCGKAFKLSCIQLFDSLDISHGGCRQWGPICGSPQQSTLACTYTRDSLFIKDIVLPGR